MEQRSARTTQQDSYARYDPYEAPHEQYPAPPSGGGTNGARTTRRRPRLPNPAKPRARGDQAAAPVSAASTDAPRQRRGQTAEQNGAAESVGTVRNRAAGSARRMVREKRMRESGEHEKSEKHEKSERGKREEDARTLRLTGLGVGVFASLLMVLLGGLVSLMPGGAPTFYGMGFVLVSMAAAVWVRPADLFAAPVAAPLAYTIGLFFAGGSGDGFTGLLQDVFTGLALHALWLYAGTVAAALISVVRQVVLVARHRRQLRAEGG